MYAIDIAHAEHIAEYVREQGVAAYAISSKTPLPERKLLIEGFRKGPSVEEKASSLENSFFENLPPSPSSFFENLPPCPSLENSFFENHNPTPSSTFENSSVPSLENSFFENSPVPSYPEEGLHRFPLNPLSPQWTGYLKPGRLGLYEQTSSRPYGVARELPTQQSCECLTQ